MWVQEKEQGKKATRTICCPFATTQADVYSFRRGDLCAISWHVELAFSTVYYCIITTVIACSTHFGASTRVTVKSLIFKHNHSPPWGRIIEFKSHALNISVFSIIFRFQYSYMVVNLYCLYFFLCAHTRDLSDHSMSSRTRVLMGKWPWTWKKKKKTGWKPVTPCLYLVILNVFMRTPPASEALLSHWAGKSKGKTAPFALKRSLAWSFSPSPHPKQIH